MNRKLLVPAASAALLLTVGVGAAFADSAPVPVRPLSGAGSAVCLEATATVTAKAQAAATVAASVTTATQAQLSAVATALATLKSAKDAQAAYTGLDPAVLTSLNAAVVKAQNDYNAAFEIVSHPVDNNQAVITARVALQAAIDAQRKVCDPAPVIPSPTPTPTPTATATATATATSTATSTPNATPTATGPYYIDCAAARAAGVAPIAKGQPGYRTELDSDGDGVACEVADDTTSTGTTTVTQVPVGSVSTGWA